MNAQQKALPDTDLSSAFAKPSRAAGLRLPPGKKAAAAPTTPERPVSPVPDLEAGQEPAEGPQGAQNGSESPQESVPAAATPTKTTARKRAAAKKAAKTVSLATGTAAPRSVEDDLAAATAKVAEPKPAAAGSVHQAGGKAPGRPAAGQGRLVLWTPLTIRARMQAVQNERGTLYLDQVLDALEATVEDLPELVSRATTPPVVSGKLFERAVAATEASERRVQLTIRGVLDSQLQVIDQLVESAGAPSRSALVNAALDATLPHV